ncbi:MAG: zf-TFIIB domain-containing protein [Candidatus Omnitrophica bacterium]|nr:zf-TFIIB domain-containing protein [Candidatus Omnitrophota bacterium]
MTEKYDLTKKKNKVSVRNGKVLHCPKCKEYLITDYNKNVEIDSCLKCKGVWVDHLEEKDILEIKPAVFTLDEVKRLMKLYKPLEKRQEAGYVPCPICKQLMWKSNWGGFSGVMVDKCGKHGTWFDDGEIEKIKEYVSLGGIEFQKARLVERGMEEVNHKFLMEVYRLDKKIDSAYMRARLFSKF